MRNQSFDRDDATAAAVVVARTRGWASVSLRTVAAELGVTAMALYRVFDDAEALRVATADAVAEPIQPVLSGRVDATFREWAVAAHAHLRNYVGLVAYVSAHWTSLPRWLDVFETLLASCDHEGVYGEQAVSKANAVFAYVLARVSLAEAATSTRRELRPIREDPQRFPLMAANVDEFASCEIDKHFTVGLNALLRGLALTQEDRGLPRAASARNVTS